MGGRPRSSLFWWVFSVPQSLRDLAETRGSPLILTPARVRLCGKLLLCQLPGCLAAWLPSLPAAAPLPSGTAALRAPPFHVVCGALRRASCLPLQLLLRMRPVHNGHRLLDPHQP